MCVALLVVVACPVTTSLSPLTAALKTAIGSQSVVDFEDNRDYCDHWIPEVEQPQILWDGRAELQPDDVNQRYEFLHQLGSGTFSQVFLAEDKSTLDQRAIKVLTKQFYSKYSRRMEAENELLVLARLPKDEPSVCRYHRFFQDEQHIYQVFDYCKGRSLAALVGPNGEDFARTWTAKIVEALSRLHSHGIYHMDLNANNVQVNADKVQIIDFGRSVLGDTKRQYNAGAFGYHTPERLSHTAATPSLWDVWYVGHLAYQLAFGGFAFGFELTPEYTRKVMSGVPDYPTEPSAELRDLLEKIFVPEARRIGLAEVAGHAWFTHFK